VEASLVEEETLEEHLAEKEEIQEAEGTLGWSVVQQMFAQAELVPVPPPTWCSIVLRCLCVYDHCCVFSELKVNRALDRNRSSHSSTSACRFTYGIPGQESMSRMVAHQNGVDRCACSAGVV
jgi:hypothetical protein